MCTFPVWYCFFPFYMKIPQFSSFHGSHFEFVDDPTWPWPSEMILVNRSLNSDANRAITHVYILTGSIVMAIFPFDLQQRRPSWIWGIFPRQKSAKKILLKNIDIKLVKSTEKPFQTILLDLPCILHFVYWTICGVDPIFFFGEMI